MSRQIGKSLNIGVDLGGTKIAMGLVTAEGDIKVLKSFPTCTEKGAEWIIERLIEEIKALFENENVNVNDIKSLGLGIPGTVDLKKGEVILAPNIYWRNIPLGEKIRAAFPDLPVYIVQDTNTAALGEFLACESDDIENLFYITISTGVGSGLIFNRKLYRGRSNTAGEVGHFIVERDGIKCTCGNRGCLQMYAKGPAIAGEALRRLNNGEKSILKDQLRKGYLTALQVGEAAIKGDTMAREVILRAAEYVGIALGNVVSLINPDLIVIGGGVVRCGSLLIDEIVRVTLTSCYPPTRESVAVSSTRLWEKSGVIGAALLHTAF